MDPSAAHIIQRDAERIAAYIKDLPKRWHDGPSRLLESMFYSLLAGGKRMRPVLLLETCRACGGDAASPTALGAAAAMELIHTFSLVHDDLPAMDNDDLRRGRPTNHKVFGEAMAILAGDAMVMAAFEVLSDVEPSLSPKLIRELSHAAGPSGMVGGQVMDIDSENTQLSLNDLRRMHAMKTGALLAASCRMGAICARANEDKLAAVTAYARHVGLAFQIVDDLLDVTSTPAELGKSTQKDADRGKNTYPALMGVEQSKASAAAELNAAIEALKPLGPPAAGLATLARFIVQRTS